MHFVAEVPYRRRYAVERAAPIFSTTPSCCSFERMRSSVRWLIYGLASMISRFVAEPISRSKKARIASSLSEGAPASENLLASSR